MNRPVLYVVMAAAAITVATCCLGPTQVRPAARQVRLAAVDIEEALYLVDDAEEWKAPLLEALAVADLAAQALERAEPGDPVGAVSELMALTQGLLAREDLPDGLRAGLIGLRSVLRRAAAARGAPLPGDPVELLEPAGALEAGS